MNHNFPRIAILMATYNGAKYIRAQLDSILFQTYKDVICYIHDDGSTDTTKDIVLEYERKYPEKFVIVEGASVGGAKRNFLFLLNKIEADIYMFCDQDDVWKLSKIEESLLEFGETNKPRCVYTDVIVVDENLIETYDSFYKCISYDPMLNSYKQLLSSNVCIGCTMLFNREARDIAIKYEFNNIMMHDWIVSLICSLFGDLIYMNRGTVLYRQHGNNIFGVAGERNILYKTYRAVRDIKGYKERKKYYFNIPRLAALKW